jgi:hypothetical protein
MKNIFFLTKVKYKFFIIFFFLLSFTDFFSNIYNINSRTYADRMINQHGFCNGISYGYVNSILTNFLINNKKAYVINFELVADSTSLFSDLEIDKTKKNLLLLNFYDENLFILKKNYNIDLNEYKLINKYKSCFFYKK